MDPVIEAPYDELSFINSLSGYNANSGLDELLDLTRVIQESGNYFFQGVSFPTGNLIVPAQSTVNGSLQIPAGSYITSIGHYFNPTVNPEGFKVRLYDKGTKASIFYGEYAHISLISAPGNPVGFVQSPFIITPPGILGWEIVNLSTVDAMIQVLLCCAIPISQQSVGQTIVSKG